MHYTLFGGRLPDEGDFPGASVAMCTLLGWFIMVRVIGDVGECDHQGCACCGPSPRTADLSWRQVEAAAAHSCLAPPSTDLLLERSQSLEIRVGRCCRFRRGACGASGCRRGVSHSGLRVFGGSVPSRTKSRYARFCETGKCIPPGSVYRGGDPLTGVVFD
jgi:hypothetical protein